jgi:pimeloyl-ACP methyl ester carboxylesterase
MRGGARVAVDPRVDDVNYTITGSGEHTVVLLHGFADNLTTWDRIVPPLAVTHRVIAIDLPGFGRTIRPWSRPLLSAYVEVVRSVLAAEGVDGPVSLMGNSMGAVVSALFADHYPDRVAGIVLIDMPGLHHVPRVWRLAMSRPAEVGLRAALRWVPHRTAQAGIGWAYGRLATGHPRDLDPFVRSCFSSPYAIQDSIPALLPLGRALLRELRAAELGPLVASATVAVLLVFGSRDVLTPARVLRRIGRPGGAVVLPGCGHCPQIDQPDALLSQVRPFLRAAGRLRGERTA